MKSFAQFCQLNTKSCAANNDFKECYFFGSDSNVKFEEFLETFPEIELEFGEHQFLQLSPNEYFVENQKNSRYFCIGIKKFSKNIFGSLLLRNRDFFFNKNQKKINFIKSKCPLHEDSQINPEQNRNIESIFLKSVSEKDVNFLTKISFFIFEKMGSRFLKTVLLCIVILFFGFFYWSDKK